MLFKVSNVMMFIQLGYHESWERQFYNFRNVLPRRNEKRLCRAAWFCCGALATSAAKRGSPAALVSPRSCSIPPQWSCSRTLALWDYRGSGTLIIKAHQFYLSVWNVGKVSITRSSWTTSQMSTFLGIFHCFPGLHWWRNGVSVRDQIETDKRRAQWCCTSWVWPDLREKRERPTRYLWTWPTVIARVSTAHHLTVKLRSSFAEVATVSQWKYNAL